MDGQGGAIIAVVMDPSSRWWVEDASAAVENMLLASVALGYGACWLEGYTLPREEEFKELLGIPKSKRLITLVPVGVPAEVTGRGEKAAERGPALGKVLNKRRGYPLRKTPHP